MLKNKANGSWPNFVEMSGFPQLKRFTDEFAPRFPSLQECLDARGTSPVSKPKGHFATVLNSNAALLYHDVDSAPWRYSEEQRELVDKLVMRNVKHENVSEKDRKELDEATLAFLTSAPKPKVPLVEELLPVDDEIEYFAGEEEAHPEFGYKPPSKKEEEASNDPAVNPYWWV